jgi:hypothetical protein
MHLEGNAAKWWQTHKQSTVERSSVRSFSSSFGSYDFRTAITEMLALKQTDTVKEYTSAFQSLQFDITMHNSNYDEVFFASKYVAGLKGGNQS